MTNSTATVSLRFSLEMFMLVTPFLRDLFFVRIPNLWNALPSDLKSESNVFKNKLKTFYFTRLRVVFDADDACTLTCFISVFSNVLKNSL